MCFITFESSASAIRQLVCYWISEASLFRCYRAACQNFNFRKSVVEKFLLSPCIFAPNVPSMLRRLRMVTRARLMLDVEGRIHLRPFPAFYFNDKNTMALSVRADTISREGGSLARKNFPVITRVYGES